MCTNVILELIDIFSVICFLSTYAETRLFMETYKIPFLLLIKICEHFDIYERLPVPAHHMQEI